MENIQNQLFFQEIFKDSLNFLKRNLKNSLLSFLGVSIVISFLFFLPYQLRSFLVSTLSIILAVEIYKTEKAQEKFTIAKVLAALKANAFMVFAISLVLCVINMIGIFLLVIPGIYVSIVLQFAVCSYLFNPELKFFEAIKHSKDLTKGRFWSIFKINFLSSVIFFIVGVAIFFASFALTGLEFGVEQGFIIYLVVLPVSIIATLFQLFFFLRVEETYTKHTN